MSTYPLIPDLLGKPKLQMGKQHKLFGAKAKQINSI